MNLLRDGFRSCLGVFCSRVEYFEVCFGDDSMMLKMLFRCFCRVVVRRFDPWGCYRLQAGGRTGKLLAGLLAIPLRR